MSFKVVKDSAGLVICFGPNDGAYEPRIPVGCSLEIVDVMPILPITAEQMRADRDARIEAIRWRVERYRDQQAAGATTADTAAQYAAVLAYVQALRDVTLQAGFPTAVNWPVVPA